MEKKWTKWYAMTSHVIAYRSLELLFSTHTFHFNCFFDDFYCVFTQIRCLSRVLMSVNIKYTVALFSALHVSVRKKNNMRLARFSRHFARNRMTPCVANVHGNHYTYLFHSLSPSDRLIFRNSLSLFGAGILEKKTSTCHSTLMPVSTCIIHVQCIKFVNAGDLE